MISIIAEHFKIERCPCWLNGFSEGCILHIFIFFSNTKCVFFEIKQDLVLMKLI